MYKDLKKVITSKDTVYQWRRVYVRKNKSNECPTLTANMGTGGHNVPLILDDVGIRKLTPRECLNFQGFPKSYKFPDDVGQSQRYKQAGNAVTVDLVKKIAIIIKKILNKQMDSKKRSKSGSHAANIGIANEHIALGILMQKYNVSISYLDSIN